MHKIRLRYIVYKFGNFLATLFYLTSPKFYILVGNLTAPILFFSVLLLGIVGCAVEEAHCKHNVAMRG